MKKLLLLLLLTGLLVSCASAPGLKTWHTDVEYNRALNASRRALIETGMAITTMDFKNGFITAEKRFLIGVVFKDVHIWQMNVYIKRIDSGILIEVGASTGHGNSDNDLMKKFEKHLKKYIPDAKLSSAY